MYEEDPERDRATQSLSRARALSPALSPALSLSLSYARSLSLVRFLSLRASYRDQAETARRHTRMHAHTRTHTRTHTKRGTRCSSLSVEGGPLPLPFLVTPCPPPLALAALSLPPILPSLPSLAPSLSSPSLSPFHHSALVPRGLQGHELAEDAHPQARGQVLLAPNPCHFITCQQRDII